MLHLGRYTTEIVQQIQSLNAQLLDPNRIEVSSRFGCRSPWRGLTSKLSEHSLEPSMIALRK